MKKLIRNITIFTIPLVLTVGIITMFFNILSLQEVNATENKNTVHQTLNSKENTDTWLQTYPTIYLTTKPHQVTKVDLIEEKEIEYETVNKTLYAKKQIYLYETATEPSAKVITIPKRQSLNCIGIGPHGWNQIEYKNKIYYTQSQNLSETKPELEYPLIHEDETSKITITKEWYQNAWCYIAHLEFKDYSRFGTECANGKYNKGYETTSHCAKRLDAIFAVNGCYSAPYLEYTVVRSGIVYNGGDRYPSSPGLYSNKTGKFFSSILPEHKGITVKDAVAKGIITDTFCFGPAILVEGQNLMNPQTDTSRAQRTFIGTNGNSGDLWIVVSDGRYVDGKSSGLTYGQCAQLLINKGCTFGVPLDGGGSSTMYFKGEVLNSAAKKERAVVDFLYFK
jgi:exopolysaccharide biosynthesis protein